MVNVDTAAQIFIGISVALLAFVQWHISRRDERQHRNAEAEERRVNSDADYIHQARQRDAAMAKWGGMVIDLMAELETACHPLAVGVARSSSQFDDLGGRASALVDRGRLFFPNVKSSLQPPNDEGIRVEILDQVLRACYVARFMAVQGSADDTLRMRNHVWRSRRIFVRLLQSEMKYSLREVNDKSAGNNIPIDPRLWEEPTITIRILDSV